MNRWLLRVADAPLRAMKDREVGECFVAIGADATPSGSEPFAHYVRSEIDEWTRIAKAANVKADF